MSWVDLGLDIDEGKGGLCCTEGVTGDTNLSRGVSREEALDCVQHTGLHCEVRLIEASMHLNT